MQTQSSKLKTQNHNANRKADLRYRSYVYSIATIKYLHTLPNTKIYWSVSDQLLRSATSIGANIVEAKSASSKRDFIKFYEIALKSANETKYRLGLLRDATEQRKEPIQKLLTEVEELAKMLGSSLLTMKNKRGL